MPGTRWFGLVYMGASYPSEPVVLEELERILEAARPANIDPARSEALDGSFIVAYTLGSVGDIKIEVNEDWADLKSVVMDRQIRASEFGSGWIKEVGRVVDRIIRGHYLVERTLWRNKVISLDVSTGDETRRFASVWSRLPIPDRFLIRERLEVDYACGAL